MTWGHWAPAGPSLGLKPHSHLEKAQVVCAQAGGWPGCSLWVHGACSAGGGQRGRLPVGFPLRLLTARPSGVHLTEASFLREPPEAGEEHTLGGGAGGLLRPEAPAPPVLAAHPPCLLCVSHPGFSTVGR